MPLAVRHHLADLVGWSRLAADGTAALADLVEHAHRDVARHWRPGRARSGGIAGLVYGGIRGTARLTSGALASVSPSPPADASSFARDAAIAALNGLLGDHLAATHNPLAIAMQLRVGGRPLDEAALPRNPRVVVLVHGLCQGDRQWRGSSGHDHGAALARDLGVAVAYLRYNSGLHVSENGRGFSHALEELLRRWPVLVEELSIVAHSMGGLVTRSAAAQAGALRHGWPTALRRIVFLGTPHHGAPLERGGQRLHVLLDGLPWTAALARLGRLRSAGITDLRHGNLLDEDWADACRFAHAADGRRPVPLPAGVECHTLAAAAGARAGALRDALWGDGFVPLASAHGDHPDPDFDLGVPAARRWTGRGMHHFDLLDHPDAYAELRSRLTR